MNYGQIISRAYDIVKKYRFLWALGILSGTAGVSFNFPMQIFQFNFDSFDRTKNSSSTLPRVLGESVSHQWFSDYFPFILLGLLLFVGLFIVLLWISLSCRAGLIDSVCKIEKNETNLGFTKAFKRGEKFAWRLFLLNLIIGILMLLLILIFAAPILILVLFAPCTATYVFIGIWAIIAILFIFIISFYLTFLSILAERIIVIKDYRVWQSLKMAKTIFRQNIGTILVLWIINLGLSLAFGIVITLGLLIVGGILFGLGLLVYYLAHVIGVIICEVIFGLALFSLILVLGGAFTAFISSFWTLAFKAILKEQNV